MAGSSPPWASWQRWARACSAWALSGFPGGRVSDGSRWHRWPNEWRASRESSPSLRHVHLSQSPDGQEEKSCEHDYRHYDGDGGIQRVTRCESALIHRVHQADCVVANAEETDAGHVT